MDGKATKEKISDWIGWKEKGRDNYVVFNGQSSSNCFFIQHGTSYTMKKALILHHDECGSLEV